MIGALGVEKVANSLPVAVSTTRTSRGVGRIASIFPSRVNARGPVALPASSRGIRLLGAQEPTSQKQYSRWLPVTSHLPSGLKATAASLAGSGSHAGFASRTSHTWTLPPPQVPLATQWPSGLMATLPTFGW